jgi:hypothetical protein
LTLDPGWKNSNPGSGINKHPGSATLRKRMPYLLVVVDQAHKLTGNAAQLLLAQGQPRRHLHRKKNKWSMVISQILKKQVVNGHITNIDYGDNA